MAPKLQPEGAGTTLRSGKTLETAQKVQNQASAEIRKAFESSDATRKAVRLAPGGHARQETEETSATMPEIVGEDVATTSSSSGTNYVEARDVLPYPNYADDPDPIPAGSSKAAQTALKKDISEYSASIFSAYTKTKLRGEMLWQDFLTAFRPHSIRSWTRPTIIQWRDLLTGRGIYIEADRKRPPAEALVDLLYRESHLGKKPTIDHVACEVETYEERKEEATDNEDVTQEIQDDGDDDKENARPKNENEDKPHDNLQEDKGSKTSHVRSTKPENPDGSDDSDSSSDDDYPTKKKDTASHEKKSITFGAETKDTEDNYADEKPSHRGRGVTTIIKAFIGQKTFSGLYDEDLETISENFRQIAHSCDATPQETRKAMFAMLSGHARTLFNRRGSSCTTFEEGLDLLRTWYNSSDKQGRLLTEWHSMNLSSAMQEKSEMSEMAVFREFVARMMDLQNQLHKDYQNDRYLRDRLLIAVDIPNIKETLNERIPRSSHQLINRVATKLSNKAGSAGSSAAMVTIEGNHYGSGQDREAMYTLGQKYEGDAQRVNSKYGPKYKTRQGMNSMNRDYQKRRFSSSWIRGVRGCFVCGKDHLAREKHPKHEVTAAIERLKKKHPKALVTITDVYHVLEMCSNDSDSDDPEVQAQWAADDGEESSGDEATYGAALEYKPVEVSLSNLAFLHGRSLGGSLNTAIGAMHATLSTQGENTEFNGIKIDTCCNKKSVISLGQYKAYCALFGLKECIKKQDCLTLTGIGGKRIPIGTTTIQIPFKDLGLIIDIDFLVLKDDVPTLLSMRDMLRNGLDISIQNRTISCANRKQKLEMKNYFLVHSWKPTDVPYAFYSEAELRVIHKTFGHPSVRATEGLLKRASNGKISRNVRESISKIAEDCTICKVHAGAPRRFKLTVGSDDLSFNHTVQVDTMFIMGRPVLHMVDLGTHFCSAVFLKNQSSGEIWRAIKSNWDLVYLGPPDHLAVDQGSAYISREMRENLEACGVTLLEAPIENRGTIGTVERYHAPLRAAFLKIRADLGRETSDAECLKSAVFAVNSTVGPEGLCPMLLVFGAVPRPARQTPAITQIQRGKAIEDAIIAAEKEQAKRRLAFGLKHNKGPIGKEVSKELYNLLAGSKVLLWRPRTKKWEGPSTLINVEGETAVVQTEAGRRIFRTTCVKPWKKAEWLSNDMVQQNEEQPSHGTISTTDDSTGYNQENGSAWMTKTKANIDPRDFVKSRKQELKGLIDNGTFVEVNRSEIPEECRIFGSRFIDELKKSERGFRKKSRLVAQNYSDYEASHIATKAPTVLRSSQRLLLSLAASQKGLKAFSRDITQAYTQSAHDLERTVYIRPPPEMGLPEGKILRVVRPLYGIPESGLHWYITYLEHHLAVLGMTRSTTDPCLLYKRDAVTGDLSGVIILQVDDTLGIGCDAFLADEEAAAKRFKCKERKMLLDNQFDFNGCNLTMKDGVISMTQEDKIKKLTVAASQTEFKSQRALAQYIGVSCRPDICAGTQLIAPGAEDITKDEFKKLNKIVAHLKNTDKIGLTFKALDTATMRMTVLTDSSFANARGLRSQLGFIIVMNDKNGESNIVHYSSARCKRITRSVMASEIHALVLGCDNALVMNHLLGEIMGQKYSLDALVDSKTVFDVIAKDGRTSEKRLQIDISAIRESYERGEFRSIGWMPGSVNPADALTKEMAGANSPLWKLMTNGTADFNAIGWSNVANKRETSECQI